MGFRDWLRPSPPPQAKRRTRRERKTLTDAELANRLLNKAVRDNPDVARSLLASNYPGIPELNPIEGLKMQLVRKRIEEDPEYATEMTEVYLDGMRNGKPTKKRDGGERYATASPMEELMDELMMETLRERLGRGEQKTSSTIMDVVGKAFEPGGLAQSVMMMILAGAAKENPAMVAQLMANQNGNGHSNGHALNGATIPETPPQLAPVQVAETDAHITPPEQSHVEEMPSVDISAIGQLASTNDPQEAGELVWGVLVQRLEGAGFLERIGIKATMGALMDASTEQIIDALQGMLSGDEWAPVFARAKADPAWADVVIGTLKARWQQSQQG